MRLYDGEVTEVADSLVRAVDQGAFELVNYSSEELVALLVR